MKMDPVVHLAEELRATESALGAAVRCYEVDPMQANGEKVNALLASLRKLYHEIAQTEPTSALGASEMVRLAAQRLPLAPSGYCRRLHEVADRLGEGRREHADLVWLRSAHAGLASGAGGEHGLKAAPLLNLAIAGASKPVVVFRCVAPPAPPIGSRHACPIEITTGLH